MTMIEQKDTRKSKQRNKNNAIFFIVILSSLHCKFRKPIIIKRNLLFLTKLSPQDGLLIEKS